MMHKSSVNLSVDSIKIGFHCFVLTAFLLQLVHSNITWNVSGDAEPVFYMHINIMILIRILSDFDYVLMSTCTEIDIFRNHNID